MKRCVLTKLAPRRGYSLAETLIAVAVFGIMLVGTVASLTSAWRGIRRARERQYVGKILESRMEEIRNLTFEEIEALGEKITFTIRPATTALGVPINPNISDEQFRMNLVGAKGVIYIDGVEKNWKKVTIRVSWRAGGGRNWVVETLTSYIVKYGVSKR